MTHAFGWWQVARLGVVQACLGAMVVVATSTLNRIMVVELSLPALVPGLLVGFHYVVQMVRPRMGFGADQGRRCSPWMLGGVAVLAVGGTLAAWATAWMADHFWQGLAVCLMAFALIGLGVSACGTSLLALMAKRVPEDMRAPAATTVWVMMIMGFAITAVTVGKLIEPYTPERVIEVTAGLGVLICVLTTLSLWRLEGEGGAVVATADSANAVRAANASNASNASNALDTASDMAPRQERNLRQFRAALAEAWADPQAKLFTVFVFLSMLAYSSQDLILEPFAGAIFGMSPGETTQLSGVHHSGVLGGMLWVALVGSRWAGGRLGSVPFWMVAGCLLSALAMTGLTVAGLQGGEWPLKANIVLLGLANGAFSIAAITTMMRLANAGNGHSQGTRMGLWGAAQAMAFGLGGVLGTALSDLAHRLLAAPGWAYSSVFSFEAVLFVVSALCAIRMGRFDTPRTQDDVIWRGPTADAKGGL
jgi:BCD family chlorophyll transporter-like MFS transporter